MTPDDDPRLTDEATGLPPLETIQPDDLPLLVAAWSASEGIAAGNGGTVAVRYLHLRGLIAGGDSGLEWAQIHVAVPVEHALDVAAALAKGTTSEL